MYKRLEYEYPSSIMGGKTGLWYITVREDDTLIQLHYSVVYSNPDKVKTIAYYIKMVEQASQYSL